MPNGGRGCGPILVVEDDDGLREYVCGLLREAGFEILAASSGDEALALAREAAPEAVVLDVCLPGVSGYEVCRGLKEEEPTLPVLFVSGERVDALDRVAGLLIGADDYLVKPFAPDELLARLRARLRRPRPARDDGDLTKRELQVLRCLAEGLDGSSIAKRLVISPRTVGTHLEHIFEKLGVRTRAQAVAAAYRMRLIEPDFETHGLA
jgi:DNA-binding NarL/FixJ family response regulator